MHIDTTAINLMHAMECHQLYAVIDAGIHEQVTGELCWLEPNERACLYSGRAAIDFEAEAPYIARLSPRLKSFIGNDLLDKPWGFLFASADPIEALVKHLKRWTKVATDEYSELTFRFYDPRILNSWLPELNPGEYSDFMLPLKFIVTFDDQGSSFFYDHPIKTGAGRFERHSNQLIKLRPEHIIALDTLKLKLSKERIQKFLAKKYQDKTQNELQALVDECCNLALPLGVVQESNIAALATVAVEIPQGYQAAVKSGDLQKAMTDQDYPDETSRVNAIVAVAHKQNSKSLGAQM